MAEASAGECLGLTDTTLSDPPSTATRTERRRNERPFDFVTMWASAGGQQLVEMLRHFSDGADRPFFVIKPNSEEPNPKSLLALVIDHGVPIDQVRDLV